MSTLTGKEIGKKIMILTNNGLEKLKHIDWEKQGHLAKEKIVRTTGKIISTWKSGTVGKVIIIAIAVLVLWICSCIFSDPSLESDEDCRIDYNSTLTLAASQNGKPEEGVGYISIGGFTVHQYLPNENAVLAMLSNNGLANLLAFTSGNAGGISESSDVGNIVYIKTPRQYTDGKPLVDGVYIYEGVVTYKTIDGGTKSVKAFREMDEKIAERKIKEDKEKRREEEERNARPVEGYTFPLPPNAKVKSICGLEFGKPPAEIEKILGKRIEGRPISSNNNTAIFMLKKPFRLCDRVKVTYYGQPPYMVLRTVEFIGNVDREKISAISCKKEVESVSKLLCKHFNLEYTESMGGDNNGECYHYNHFPDHDGRIHDGRIDVRYDMHNGTFSIKYISQELTADNWYDTIKRRIQQKAENDNEKKKKELSFDEEEGGNML